MFNCLLSNFCDIFLHVFLSKILFGIHDNCPQIKLSFNNIFAWPGGGGGTENISNEIMCTGTVTVLCL